MVDVLLAGGGTFGHLAPLLAIAEELDVRGLRSLLVGARGRVDHQWLRSSGRPYSVMRLYGFTTGSMLRRIAGLLLLPLAIARALLIVGASRAVIVSGGFVSLPIGLAAILLRKPFAVVEPNALAGRATRLFARMATVTFAPFSLGLPKGDVIVCPVPLRKDIRKVAHHHRGKGLLVIGGSQGASPLSELVASAIKDLSAIFEGEQVVWITGSRDFTQMSEMAKPYDNVEVHSFLGDMAHVYSSVGYAISRAGALSLAELFACGISTVMIPLPHAADDHQRRNAEAYQKLGMGAVMEQSEATGPKLVEAIRRMRTEPEKHPTKAGLWAEGHRIVAEWAVAHCKAGAT